MTFGKILLTILSAAVVLGFFYVMTLFAPGKKAPDNYVFVDPEKEALELLQESEDLESQFEKEASVGEPSQESVDKLRRAIRLQEIYIDKAYTSDRSPAQRLVKLQTRLHNIEAKPMSKIADEFAAKAEQADSKGDIALAQDLYRQAYDMQSRINSEYPLSKYKNIKKVADYDRMVKMLQARPLYLKSVEAENAAREALKKEDWKLAQDKFEQAIEILSQMNSDFPTSIYTDFARLQKLDIDLASLKSTELHEKVEEYIKRAEEYQAKNDTLLASEAYSDAVENQRTLNRMFPKSRHASEEKVVLLEKKKMDAYSWKFSDDIFKQDELLSRALIDGDYAAAREISENLLRKAEQFKIDFPKSQTIGNDLVLRLRYINYMMRDISKIRALVLNSLQKVDASDDVQMLKHEVTQELFSLVMQENPSRYSDNPRNPVDSVSYADAERFCSRLSWLLARRVEIPSEELFKKAIGSLRYVDVSEISWNAVNSGGVSKEVATKKPNDRGFFDLLGNVSEFVVPSSAGISGAKFIGGSSQTTTDKLVSIEEGFMDVNQRNRTVGFRIVVYKPNLKK